MFGPVLRVSFRREEGGIFQLMVQVNSICSEIIGGISLVWVTISSGTTQWARWHSNTGNPNIMGNLPEPPEPDRSLTRSDLGIQQEDRLPEGLREDGNNGP